MAEWFDVVIRTESDVLYRVEADTRSEARKRALELAKERTMPSVVIKDNSTSVLKVSRTDAPPWWRRRKEKEKDRS